VYTICPYYIEIKGNLETEPRLTATLFYNFGMNILAINPVSSADYLVKRFHEMQIPLIVVATNSAKDEKECQLYPYLDYSSLAVEKIIDTTALTEIDTIHCIDAVNETYHFSHGFSGAEGGLDVSEKILAHLFPKCSNNPATSQYRFDKYWMNEALHEQEIPSISQITIATKLKRNEQIKLAKRFYEEQDHNIVIKPRSGSAASVDVFKPSSFDEIEQYFNHEHKGTFYRSDYLLQEMVYGDEYYIDFASYAGQNRLTAIGRIEKEIIAGSFEYLYADNLSLESQFAKALSRYALQCLKALGVENGFSHIEIKETPEGFRLIELNPRLSGSDGFHNIMSKRRYNVDQIDAYINLISNTQSQKIVPKQPIFQRLVYFKNKNGAYDYVDLEPIKSLSSYVSHKLRIESMPKIPDTSNSMLNIVMYILLEADQEAIIEHDFQRLMDYQRTDNCLKCTK